MNSLVDCDNGNDLSEPIVAMAAMRVGVAILGGPPHWGNLAFSGQENKLNQVGILYMAMDQYLYIPFLGGWTSIYQLFWCSPGVQGFDTLPYIYILVDG